MGTRFGAASRASRQDFIERFQGLAVALPQLALPEALYELTAA